MKEADGHELVDVVRARRFVLVDAAGEVRASLAVRPDGAPGLILLDAAGKPRVVLAVRSDGAPHLTLFDAAGNPCRKVDCRVP